MNSENEKYVEIVKRIKGIQPTISDPKGLTSKTMHRIEFMSKRKTHNKVYSIISLTSSIAASFLIGLFLFEFLYMNENVEFQSSKIISGYVLNRDESDLNFEKSIAMHEFANLLMIKQKQHKKQLSYYSKVINKHKIL